MVAGGLDATPLKDLLIFKGGTALKRCYFGDYRFSEDLDFTLGRRVDFPEIRRGLDEVFGKVTTDSGISFAFESQEQAGHTNRYTFYLGYQGPLPKPNSVKVDITIEEVIVLPLEQRPVLRAYDEFEDLPNNRTLTVYSPGRNRRGKDRGPQRSSSQRTARPLRSLVPHGQRRDRATGFGPGNSGETSVSRPADCRH